VRRWLVGLGVAAVFHLAVLLFGGLLFLDDSKDKKKETEMVDLVSTETPKEQKEPEEEKASEQEPASEEKAEEPMETPDAMPDLRDLDRPAIAAAPAALDAASLSALEDMMNGTSGAQAGFVTDTVSLASGGRIGGLGTAPIEGADLGAVFTVTEMDQRPRAIYQAPPMYPVGLRKRKIEGNVSVLFVVDETGRVTEPKVERSTNPGFEPAALEAVRQWKFEPGTRNGKKVPCRMRAPLTFRVS
jgi:protein TonB